MAVGASPGIVRTGIATPAAANPAGSGVSFTTSGAGFLHDDF
jgi:hypothetical protein